ncbi:PREDICTED: 2-hydroxyisoflavanone dehydratase-like [Ipomoea nil]|uniref:2-hydroxyisoflavanone dehydratase-like n=1 Tax=Ipomoea nil TaxID=35883 RepID=UPI0009010519|nr:PREDICTED: 2-hydroxyisoflavanone dehydratase-like [Ipomoea nil]
MGSSSSKIAHDFFSFVHVYEDGRVKRLLNYKPISPTGNPTIGVRSKGVVIVSKTNVWARMYLPRTTDDDQKFPLLVFIHGGTFCIGSAFDHNYDNFLHSLRIEANTVTLFVEYRLARSTSSRPTTMIPGRPSNGQGHTPKMTMDNPEPNRG